jgi:hypothetical protein
MSCKIGGSRNEDVSAFVGVTPDLTILEIKVSQILPVSVATTNASVNSSTDQGGGKRRLVSVGSL